MTNHSKAIGGKEINVFDKTYLFERWKRGQRHFYFFYLYAELAHRFNVC